MRRSAVVLAVPSLLVMCVVAAACGQDGPERAVIPLVPRGELPPGEWSWTAECRVGPAGAASTSGAGCDAAGPHLGAAQFAGNAWNLGGVDAAGSLLMSTAPDTGLTISADLSDAPPCTDAACIAPEANTWVRAFPSVLYGVDLCHADTSPASSADLRLPMRVASLPSGLVGTTTYDADAADVTHNVAYDLWLNPSGSPSPCKADGTVEVMVWTDYDDAALLPDSLRVGTATIPFAVDGHDDAGTDSWAVYASNVFGDGHTQPWGGTIWLVLDRAHRTGRGTVSVDLGGAIGAATGLLENTYGWKDVAESYWLDAIAFGVEIGPAGADVYGGGPVDFSVGISSYCLETGVTVAAAGC